MNIYYMKNFHMKISRFTVIIMLQFKRHRYSYFPHPTGGLDSWPFAPLHIEDVSPILDSEYHLLPHSSVDYDHQW